MSLYHQDAYFQTANARFLPLNAILFISKPPPNSFTWQNRAFPMKIIRVYPFFLKNCALRSPNPSITEYMCGTINVSYHHSFEILEFVQCFQSNALVRWYLKLMFMRSIVIKKSAQFLGGAIFHQLIHFNMEKLYILHILIIPYPKSIISFLFFNDIILCSFQLKYLN